MLRNLIKHFQIYFKTEDIPILPEKPEIDSSLLSCGFSLPLETNESIYNPNRILFLFLG